MNLFKKNAGWALIIRGILFMMFGMLVLFMESKTIYGPMNFFGFVLLGSGVLYIILSLMLRKTYRGWLGGVIWGALDMAVAVYVLFNMARATDIFTSIIGVFAVVMGLAILLSAFYIRKYRIFLYINSIVSLVFGFNILFNPTIGRLDFMIGLYALLFGMLVAYGGFTLVRSAKAIPPGDLQEELKV